jgi:hypothetical protein
MCFKGKVGVGLSCVILPIRYQNDVLEDPVYHPGDDRLG